MTKGDKVIYTPASGVPAIATVMEVTKREVTLTYRFDLHGIIESTAVWLPRKVVEQLPRV